MIVAAKRRSSSSEEESQNNNHEEKQNTAHQSYDSTSGCGTSEDPLMENTNYNTMLHYDGIPQHKPLATGRFIPFLKTENDLRHEKQKLQLCGKHSINNLLQLETSTKQFDKVADDIFENERQLYYGSVDSASSRVSLWFKRKTMSNHHKRKFLISFGNYSYEVMESILRKHNLDMVTVRKNWQGDAEGDPWGLNNPNSVGLLFNLQRYETVNTNSSSDEITTGCFCFVPFSRKKKNTPKPRQAIAGHWWAIGKVRIEDGQGGFTEHWYNHDSQYDIPQKLNDISEVYKVVNDYVSYMGNSLLMWKITSGGE